MLAAPTVRLAVGISLEGHARPTLELILTEAPVQLRRQFNPAAGLALIDL